MFADFTRLAALHAGAAFLPRQLTYRGSRLVFSWGIVPLGLVACMLIIVLQAGVTALIPLSGFTATTKSWPGNCHLRSSSRLYGAASPGHPADRRCTPGRPGRGAICAPAIA